MQAQQIDKSILEQMVCINEWVAGEEPQDKENPWEFRTDGTFTTLKDGHGGNWSIDMKNDIILKLKWTTVNGYADFKFDKISQSCLKLKCQKSGWGFMMKWKLELVEKTKGTTSDFSVKMSLLSHLKQGLVFSDQEMDYGGHKVNFFTLGKKSKSVELYFKKLPTGYVIQLDNNRRRGLDVAHGKYEAGTEVVMWQSHAGKNQIFVINHDKSISPQLAPYLVLGVKDGRLQLVHKNDSSILLFDQVSVAKPDYPLFNMTLESHPGKGIHLSSATRQYGHGCDTDLKLGPADKAISFFIDNDGFIHIWEMPFQVLDAWDPANREPHLFGLHTEYGHHKFAITNEKTIALKHDHNWVLGANQNQKNLKWVKRNSKNRLVFKMENKTKAVAKVQLTKQPTTETMPSLQVNAKQPTLENKQSAMKMTEKI